MGADCRGDPPPLRRTPRRSQHRAATQHRLHPGRRPRLHRPRLLRQQVLRDAEHRPPGGAGARFTDGYTCGPNCQPTRAALMSGQYGPRTGVYTVGNIDRFDWHSRPLRPVDNVTELPLDKITLRQRAQEGRLRHRHVRQMASRRGQGSPSQSSAASTKPSSRLGKHFNFKTQPADRVSDEDVYLADFLTDRAVDFIRRHKDGPFFLYLPHFGVHAPARGQAGADREVQGQAGRRRTSRSDLRGDDRQRRRKRRPRVGHARRTEAAQRTRW